MFEEQLTKVLGTTFLKQLKGDHYHENIKTQ